MFFGEFSINLDGNGRLAIPTRFRQGVADSSGGKLVITYNPYESHSLWIYPFDEWDRVQTEVMSLSTFNASHRRLQRLLVGSASPVEPDGHYRIQIPQALREVAKLEKRIILMGLGQKFELWNEDVLNQARHNEDPLAQGEASEQMIELRL